MLFYLRLLGDNNMTPLYPFKVRIEVQYNVSTYEIIAVMGKIEEWLDENIDRNSYLAFPNPENWKECFFNNEEDAFYFKMRWG